MSQIHEQIKSNEYTLPNFNLTNYNFLDTTKFLTQSLENVEKSFEYAVDTIVDVVSVVNGTKIGLPQIDVRKEEAINKINSLANSVLSNIDDIKETVENLKQKKIKWFILIFKLMSIILSCDFYNSVKLIIFNKWF